MKPYYEKDGITIYHGDCRELLVNIDADSVVTDPPWPGVALDWSEAATGLFSDCCHLIHTRVCPSRIAVQIGCDTDPRFLAPIRLDFFRVCWLDVARPHYKGRLLDGATPAYLYGEPPPSKEGGRVVPGMFRDSDSKGKQFDHPCPRKLGQVRWLVRWWTAPGDVVLDPFCGTGTTLVAAKDYGLRADGS